MGDTVWIYPTSYPVRFDMKSIYSGMYKSRLVHGHLQKMMSSFGIPLQECIKHQAINSALLLIWVILYVFNPQYYY